MNPFSMKTVPFRNGFKIDLSGTLNETAKLDKLPSDKFTELFINLNFLANINSIGIRNWILWCKHLPVQPQFTFSHCPCFFVEQMSAIRGLVPPGSIISSFYIPYFCESCNCEDHFLAELGVHYKREKAGDWSLHLKDKTCARCIRPMEVSTNLNKYFRFFKLI